MPSGVRSGLSSSKREPPEAQTVGDVIDAEAGRLASAGVQEPRRQAAAMWAWLAGASVGQVWLGRGSTPEPELLGRFRGAIERRLTGEPLPYVVGMAGFRTLELEVDSRVLIPRPETEGLVEHVLDWARRHSRWGVVADIGTGSGCIALALAVEGCFTRVVATDASAAALAVAQRNVERISPPTPVLLREGVLWEPLEGERCDVIVSNPPYVSEAEFDELEPGVRLFEPRQALVSQEGGMENIRQLLAGAGDYLVPLGLLALEVDSERAEDTRALATEQGWSRVCVEQDLFERPRYLLATWEP